MDEKYCKFVSSYGIMKSCDYIFGLTPIPLESKPCLIYVHFDYIPLFISSLDLLKFKFILVTSGSDHTVIEDIKDSSKTLLDSDKIISWYSQNVLYNHPKLKPIPIGMDYHTLSAPHNSGLTKNNETFTPLFQEFILSEIRKKTKPLKQTKIHAVTNFHLGMGPPLRRTLIRNFIYDKLKNKSCITWLDKQYREDFWKSLNDNAFVICPIGNGLDTYRAWETLILGRIPIIEASEFNKIYDDLPVAIIDNWDDL